MHSIIIETATTTRRESQYHDTTITITLHAQALREKRVEKNQSNKVEKKRKRVRKKK